MNTLKQQINETRNYLYQNRMYSELEGFDTALRMFADANKKSFKDKAAEEAMALMAPKSATKKNENKGG